MLEPIKWCGRCGQPTAWVGVSESMHICIPSPRPTDRTQTPYVEDAGSNPAVRTNRKKRKHGPGDIQEG